MSDTNQQPPIPLLYQMGLVVGQSMAGISSQVRAELKEDVAQLDDEFERIRLNTLLKLGLF